MSTARPLLFASATVLVLGLSACGGGSAQSATAEPLLIKNQPPVAKAQLSHSNQQTGGLLQLDASLSTDPEQDSLSYSWQLTGPDGKAVVLENTTAVTTQVITPVAGEYIAELKVTDSKGLSSKHQQSLRVSAQPAITATIVGVTSASQGQLLTYRAELNSLELEQPQYQWQLTQKPPLSQSSPTLQQGLSTTLQPDQPGDYILQLTVTDSKGISLIEQLSLNVSAIGRNAAPSAVIGLETTSIKVNENIKLSASNSSDPEGKPLSYLWEILHSPTGAVMHFSAPTGLNTEFVANLAGTYKLQLTVSDGEKKATQLLNLRADTHNQPPRAELSSSQKKIRPGDTVKLTATATDPEADVLTYQWRLGIKPRASQAQLTAPTAATTELTADLEGEYIIWLQVSDGEKKSFPKGVKIEAYHNFAPEVTIQPFAGIVAVGDNRSLTAYASDVEGSPLSYQWTVVEAPVNAKVQLSQPSQASTEFSADVPGNYYLSIVVTDNQGKASAPLKALIQVN